MRRFFKRTVRQEKKKEKKTSFLIICQKRTTKVLQCAKENHEQ